MSNIDLSQLITAEDKAAQARRHRTGRRRGRGTCLPGCDRLVCDAKDRNRADIPDTVTAKACGGKSGARCGGMTGRNDGAE